MWDSIIARLDPRQKTLSSLLALSVVGHILFLLILFLRIGYSTVTLSLKTHERRLLMMRGIKRMPHGNGTGGLKTGGLKRDGARRSAAQQVKQKQERKVTPQQTKQLVVPSVSRHKQLVEKNQKRHGTSASKVKKAPDKKALEKKQVQKIPKEEKKPIPRAELNIPRNAPVSQPVVQEVAVSEHTDANEPYRLDMGSSSNADGDDGPCDVIDEMRSALCATWKPPRGVKPRKPCTVRVQLNDVGAVISASVVTSSGNGAFDMAARRSLCKARYPRAVWQRAIVVSFS